MRKVMHCIPLPEKRLQETATDNNLKSFGMMMKSTVTIKQSSSKHIV